MTNKIIPEAEVLAVKKVIEAVEELAEIHKCTNPILNGSEDNLDRLHTLIYLHAIKDLVEASGALKGLLEDSREDFEKNITNNGDREVEEVLLKVMLSELMKIK